MEGRKETGTYLIINWKAGCTRMWTLEVASKYDTRGQFKVPPELPWHRNRLARCFMPQTFGMFKQGKISFGLGLRQPVSQTSVCKGNKTADSMTTGLMTTGLKIKNMLRINITMSFSSPIKNAFRLLM